MPAEGLPQPPDTGARRHSCAYPRQFAAGRVQGGDNEVSEDYGLRSAVSSALATAFFTKSLGMVKGFWCDHT